MSITPLQASSRKEWIEVVPTSVTAGMDPARPVMIFKEKKGEGTLPVWLSPLDAGIAITQDHVKNNATSPHDLASKVFEQLQLTLEKCFFTDIKGHHQYVELHFKGSDRIKTISTRADQAISFCLHQGALFYCTKDYMLRSREQDAHLTKFSSQLKIRPDMGKNRHPYLM